MKPGLSGSGRAAIAEDAGGGGDQSAGLVLHAAFGEKGLASAPGLARLSDQALAASLREVVDRHRKGQRMLAQRRVAGMASRVSHRGVEQRGMEAAMRQVLTIEKIGRKRHFELR